MGPHASACGRVPEKVLDEPLESKKKEKKSLNQLVTPLRARNPLTGRCSRMRRRNNAVIYPLGVFSHSQMWDNRGESARGNP